MCYNIITVREKKLHELKKKSNPYKGRKRYYYENERECDCRGTEKL